MEGNGEATKPAQPYGGRAGANHLGHSLLVTLRKLALCNATLQLD